MNINTLAATAAPSFADILAWCFPLVVIVASAIGLGFAAYYWGRNARIENGSHPAACHAATHHDRADGIGDNDLNRQRDGQRLGIHWQPNGYGGQSVHHAG